MNSDKPLPADQNQTSLSLPEDADDIPILSEALDLPAELSAYEASPPPVDETIDSTEKAPEQELHVDLGYADELAYAEDDDLLTEIAEIHTLPLAEMVLDDSPNSLESAEQKQQIATLEAIVFEGDNPNVLAPRKTEGGEAKSGEATLHPELTPEEAALGTAESLSYVTPPSVSPPLTKPLPKTSDNPFLPQHILDRLNQGKRNLVEEIAQSSAALDASTAILRTHARAERLTKPTFSDTRTPQNTFSRDKSAQQKQKMVDDLVEEYLPLIAAELRRRLRRLLDE